MESKYLKNQAYDVLWVHWLIDRCYFSVLFCTHYHIQTHSIRTDEIWSFITVAKRTSRSKLMVYFKKYKKKVSTAGKIGLHLYLTGRKFWLGTSLFHFLGLQAYPNDLWYPSILVIPLSNWNVVSSLDLNAAPLALFHRLWVPTGGWFSLALTASHRVSTKCEESDQQTFHPHRDQ